METYSAFLHGVRIANGSRSAVISTLRGLPLPAAASDLLIFDDSSGRQTDFDLRETLAAEEPAAPRPRGRPGLGVVAREITLLPRHWEWLGEQPGGASATLRKLVEAARKRDAGRAAGQSAAFRFLSAIAGDRPQFEEATRALFAGDRPKFEQHMQSWPAGIRDYAAALAFAEAPEGPAG